MFCIFLRQDIKMTLRTQIHRSDPYAGFTPDTKPDMQGWGSAHHIFELLVRKVKPSLIIEVGSWKGASALKMAACCRDLQLDTQIVCVDTWLGSPGLYTRENDAFYDSLKHVNGYPSLYYTFLSNIVRQGAQDFITPLPLPSVLAAETLRHFGAQADLIYIDAAHDYESVLADLKAFWPLLKPTGVLFGDDYLGWPGVTKAANQLAFETGCPIYAARGKFVIPKSGKFEIAVNFS